MPEERGTVGPLELRRRWPDSTDDRVHDVMKPFFLLTRVRVMHRGTVTTGIARSC